ncbi:MAG: nitroreductase family protein [Kiritimatiellia bacterium]
MEVADILSRRSIRKYTSEPVTAQQLHLALEAAMASPSAMRCDPWRYIVLTDRAALDDLAGILPYGKMLLDAPAAIIVCGELSVAHRQELSYLLQDVSASIENLLLALHAQGLGSVWLGIHPNEDRIIAVSKRFNLPEGILPISAISIGHPAEHHEPRTRFDATKVHTNGW